MKKIIRVWLVLIVLSTGVYSCLPLYPYGYENHGYRNHEYRERDYRDRGYDGHERRDQDGRQNRHRDENRNQGDWKYNSPDE